MTTQGTDRPRADNDHAHAPAHDRGPKALAARTVADLNCDDSPEALAERHRRWDAAQASPANRELLRVCRLLQRASRLANRYADQHPPGRCRCDFCAFTAEDTDLLYIDLRGAAWAAKIGADAIDNTAIRIPPELAERLGAADDNDPADADDSSDEPVILKLEGESS